MTVRAARQSSDRGTVTAELAIALPAVVLMAILIVVVAVAGMTQLRVADAARAGARSAALGESEDTIRGIVGRLAGPDARVAISHAPPWVTVTVLDTVGGRGLTPGAFVVRGEASARVEE